MKIKLIKAGTKILNFLNNLITIEKTLSKTSLFLSYLITSLMSIGFSYLIYKNPFKTEELIRIFIFTYITFIFHISLMLGYLLLLFFSREELEKFKTKISSFIGKSKKNLTLIIKNKYEPFKINYLRMFLWFSLFILITSQITPIINQLYFSEDLKIDTFLLGFVLILVRIIIINRFLRSICLEKNIKSLSNILILPLFLGDIIFLFVRFTLDDLNSIQPLKDLITDFSNIAINSLPDIITKYHLLTPSLIILIGGLLLKRQKNPFQPYHKQNNSLTSIANLIMFLMMTLMQVILIAQSTSFGEEYRFSAGATAFVMRDILAFILILTLSSILYQRMKEIQDDFQNINEYDKKTQKEKIIGTVCGTAKYKFSEISFFGFKQPKISKFIIMETEKEKIKLLEPYSKSIFYKFNNLLVGDKIEVIATKQHYEEIGVTEFEYYVPIYYKLNEESILRLKR